MTHVQEGPRQQELNMKAVADVLQEDRHITVMELTEATGISAASVHQI